MTLKGEDFRVSFFFIIHNTKPSLFGGIQKWYWRRIFGGFGGFT